MSSRSAISYPTKYLEHPLDGIRAKLERADESVRNLNSEINEFLTDEMPLYEIESGFYDNPLKYEFRAKKIRQVPLRFSVLAGEVIHHCRSCLDHLIVQLAATTGQRMLNTHQFPICRKREKFKKACSSGQIKGVPYTAFCKIVRTQPFHRSAPDEATIAAIHQLDIRDKHSLLLVVSQTVKIGPDVEVGASSRQSVITHLGSPGPHILTDGEIEIFSLTLESPVNDFKASAQFTTNIAMRDVAGRQVVPIIPLLAKIASFTRKTVDDFSGYF